MLSAAPPTGNAIYAMHCAACHGDHGEGADDAPDPLHGTRSIDALTRYIERRMPEDDPTLVTGADAAAVAAYIHGAFYSPQARDAAELPARPLLRLTNRQFRESIADLFAPDTAADHGSRDGLTGRYFSSEGMNRRAKHHLDRVDAAIDFDYGDGAPADDVDPEKFSITWTGTLLPETTGWHEFRLSTPNGARLHVNAPDGAPALIDEWVSSGNETRVATARSFLLGGRAYPLRLDFFKYQEARAAVRLEWKPPHGVWRVLEAPVLSTLRTSATLCISTTFPPDDASEGYQRGSDISRAWHDAVAAAAVEAANHVHGRLEQLTGAAPDDPQRIEKYHAFVNSLATRAFRRPLDAAEADRIITAAFAQDIPPDDAVKRAVIRILTSPAFLYPALGAASAGDDHDTASRLALALWDSLPDAGLSDAARRGELKTPEEIRHHAERMARHPRARAKLNAAIHRWLAIDQPTPLQKDPQKFPGFDEELAADLRESLVRFLDHSLWHGDAADLRLLLNSTTLFANRRIADFYQIDIPAADDGFHPVENAGEHLAGVLTHPYLMARLAHHDHTSPIHRGVFLTRQILGLPLRPPPEAIAFDSDHFNPAWTTREKVVEMTREPSCMTCHETINPLGFSLEHFDAVGRLQTHENNRPIDTTAEFITHEGLVLHLQGPRDVAAHANTSEVARRAFIRRIFQILVHHPPEVHGHQTVDSLDAAFTAHDHNIRRLFIEAAILAATPPAATTTNQQSSP